MEFCQLLTSWQREDVLEQMINVFSYRTSLGYNFFFPSEVVLSSKTFACSVPISMSFLQDLHKYWVWRSGLLEHVKDAESEVLGRQVVAVGNNHHHH